MAQLTDTGRPGKKRYRVRWQGVGGSRTSEFADACDAYREFYLRERFAWENASEDTACRKREVSLKVLLEFYFGRLCDDVALKRISPSYFRGQRYNFEKLRERWRRDSPEIRRVSAPDLSAITAYNHRVFLRRAYALAIEVGMCTRNPCRVARAEVHYSSGVAPEKFATQEQVMALLAFSDDPRLRLAVYLGAACGLRISEVAALRFESIRGDSLVIDRHLTEAGIQPGLKYGRRTVLTVTEEFHQLLAAIPVTGRYVFEKKGGGHYASVASFRRGVLKEAFSRVGMTAEGKDFHSLRHYAVSVWASWGMSLEEISKWLDHSSPAVTMKTYLHLFNTGKHRCFLGLELG